MAIVLSAPAGVLAQNDTKVQDGKVVTAGAGKLTITDADGKNKQTLLIPATAKITCDRAPCKLEDLKEGFFVQVTILNDAKQTVSKVDGKSNK
jgi:hypothetical protein